MSSQSLSTPTKSDVDLLNSYIRAAKKEPEEPGSNWQMRFSFTPISDDLSNVFGKKFQPSSPSATPLSTFLHGPFKIATNGGGPPGMIMPPVLKRVFPSRFWDSSGRKDILIYTDGACLNNGQANATAGCAFVYRPSEPEGVAFRLENRGPDKVEYTQTSNRAELRAVIGALKFRNWSGEVVDRVIIATDSQYVMDGATEWAKNWESNGWKTANGQAVKNKDLWKSLLKEIRNHGKYGVEVLFWKIPRELNVLADAAAKKAALEEESPEYGDISGICV